MNPPSIEQPCLQRAPGSESLANVTSPTEADTSAPDLRLVLPTPCRTSRLPLMLFQRQPRRTAWSEWRRQPMHGTGAGDVDRGHVFAQFCALSLDGILGRQTTKTKA